MMVLRFSYPPQADHGAEDDSEEDEGWDDESQDSQEEEGAPATTMDLSKLLQQAPSDSTRSSHLHGATLSHHHHPPRQVPL